MSVTALTYDCIFLWPAFYLWVPCALHRGATPNTHLLNEWVSGWMNEWMIVKAMDIGHVLTLRHWEDTWSVEGRWGWKAAIIDWILRNTRHISTVCFLTYPYKIPSEIKIMSPFLQMRKPKLWRSTWVQSLLLLQSILSPINGLNTYSFQN